MSFQRVMVRVMSLLLGVMVGGGRGDLVDLKPYQSLILKHHNDLRKTVSPQASDMRQIVWDDVLARNAEEWAEYCRYERPPGYMYNSGSNLAYQRYHVNRRKSNSIRSNVLQGLRSWSREREFFKYSDDCGMACAYVQMIFTSAYRIGCALNTCSRLQVGDQMESYSTLFLCFYAPRGRLMQTYPYRTGHTCSECPKDTVCSEGLCVEAGMMPPNALAADSAAVASFYGPANLELPPYEVTVSPLPSLPRQMSTDQLTASEVSFLMQVQNTFRSKEGHPQLRWDTGLKRWTDWIVSCEADYPGPPYTYTNFFRIPENMPIYEVVYEWSKEGMDPNIQLQKGCRTPYDHSDCNHYTNMMQHTVKMMACSARNCNDGNRQLVCIYEDPMGLRQP